MPKSICFIDGRNEIGTGALYEMDEIPKYRCLVTCFHVLSTDYISEAKIKFKGCDHFKLKPEWIGRKSLKPRGEGDYMAIELKPAAVAFLEKQGLKFLKVSSTKVDDQIIVYGYPDAKLENPVLYFGHGCIESINDFSLSYYAAAGPGSSVSPLVLWTRKAIGIHRSRQDNSDTLNCSSQYCRATTIRN